MFRVSKTKRIVYTGCTHLASMALQTIASGATKDQRNIIGQKTSGAFLTIIQLKEKRSGDLL